MWNEVMASREDWLTERIFAIHNSSFPTIPRSPCLSRRTLGRLPIEVTSDGHAI